MAALCVIQPELSRTDSGSAIHTLPRCQSDVSVEFYKGFKGQTMILNLGRSVGSALIGLRTVCDVSRLRSSV